MHQDMLRILFNNQEIDTRCQELAKEIDKYYKDSQETILVIGVLKGCIPFMANLIKYINTDVELDFLAVSSYDGKESIGDVKIEKDLNRSIKNTRVLVVEDIVDTGRTIKEVRTLLMNKGAKEVKVVSLLDKPSRRVVEAHADFIGFEVENYFVVGFGFDYNERYRQLPYIGVLKEEKYR